MQYSTRLLTTEIAAQKQNTPNSSDQNAVASLF